MADVTVLTYQKVIAGHEWVALKRDPELLERYIKADARQHIAAEIAKRGLAVETLAEPDPSCDDPMRQTNAVLKLTVAVARKEEVSALARDLAEAEDRGFQRAIAAMKGGLESVAPRLGPTAYAHGALDALIHRVESAWNHRPAADWQPMRSAPGWGTAEYLFANGEVGRSPRLRIPKPLSLADARPAVSDYSAQTIEVEELEAIAWRHAGRHPHSAEAA